MKRILVFLLFLATQWVSVAGNYRVSSPDGRLTVTVSDGACLLWSLKDGETLLMGPSAAGMSLSGGGSFGTDCRVRKVSRKTRDEMRPTPHYKKAAVQNHFNELTLTFKDFQWVVRMYNDGVAYRFISRLKGSFHVLSEEAQFCFPEDGKAWIPYVKQNTETLESQLFNSFENTYEVCPLSEWKRERLAFLPLVTEVAGIKLCLSEADLVDYPGMFLYPAADKGTALQGVFARVPEVVEQGGHNHLQGIVKSRKEYIAEVSGPRAFPWRMVSVAREDKDLLDDDMVARLASPPSPDADFSWVKPGKVAWEWWNNWNVSGVPFQAGVNTATYKRYIDFASDFGVPYVILDEGWAVKGAADLFQVVPAVDLEELVRYAGSKGVDIILWAGYLAFERDMEKACREYAALGVKGFKIDFMDRDDQPMVRFYEQAAATAARYHLIVDFHGAYKPTGLQFTWPNVLNFEGVHGLEQLKWSNPEQMTYDVTMPFVRMLAGPVDYTQGAMTNANKQNFRAIYANPMSQGTRCHQLAEYIVFLSPLNMLCDSPDKYRADPECTRFIAACPEVWDESVTLQARMGESLATARRKGDTWYIGALTDWARRDLVLNLSALGEGPWELELFRDGANAARNGNDYVHETRPVTDTLLRIHMGPGGGWAGILRPAKKTEEDRFIDALLARMSLEEKIGQMNLPVAPSDIVTGQEKSENVVQAIREGKVGAVLNAVGQESVGYYQKVAVEESRLGIPLLFGLDVVHGCRTSFAVPLALAASWDLDLARRTAAVAAWESAEEGVNWTYAPMVDISRDPRWGRCVEGYGEDPLLSGRMGAAQVQGYQGNLTSPANILACVKHFAAYGASESGRDYKEVDMSPERLYNVYLEPYRACVEAGAASVMTSFNDMNGETVNVSEWLLTEVLRRQWGFTGFTVSDYNAVKEMVRHGLGSLEEVSARALLCGLDMEMVSEGFLGTLPGAVQSGKVSEAAIDAACRNILRWKYRLGLFSDPYRQIRQAEPDDVKQKKELSRRLSEESFVLLKNDGTLPLKRGARLAVVGPFAAEGGLYPGSWSALATKSGIPSLLEVLQEEGVNFTYARGAHILESAKEEAVACGRRPYTRDSRSSEELLREALEAVKDADVILATLGEGPYQTGESNSRTSLDIPPCQKELLKALAGTGKPLVLLLFSGRPLTLEWEDRNLNAILDVWYGGDCLAKAISRTVFGEVCPSGKLTMTFPRSVGQIPAYYAAKPLGRPARDPDSFVRYQSSWLDSSTKPLYPFGYGLSYTRFSYSDLQISKDTLSEGERLTVSVTVSNTGAFDADEIVQLYIRDVVSSMTRPVMELKDFRRVHIPAGERVKVDFSLTPDQLGWYYVDQYNMQGTAAPLRAARKAEAGEYKIMVGPSSEEYLTASVLLK